MEEYSDNEATCSALDAEHYEEDGSSCPATMTTSRDPVKTLLLVVHIFFTIIPILFSVAFAVVASRKFHLSSKTWRFLLDFTIIVLPIILNVTVFNPYVEVICAVLVIAVFLVFRSKNMTHFVDNNKIINLGKQPSAITLLRSTINVITAACILAIDFKSFPKSFRKSRTYGVGLMDTGIGLFVFSMGVVSKPPKSRSDFMKLPKMVGPALLLGLARTVVLTTIDYHQDQTEYGRHMNAFFTLGLTKLIGSLVSSVVIREYQLLLIGMIMLTSHECLLLSGLAKFVMDRKNPRATFFDANREGICSLPGFIGIYLISMYIARVLFSESTLVIKEYTKKVKKLGVAAACSWILVVFCCCTMGISRRVSNFGYVAWIMSIALTMLLLFIILSDYAFHGWLDSEQDKLPVLMDAINRNGLVFFLVANILTGCVNMFLSPDDRDVPASILILSIYMLLSTTLVFVLYRLRIKIA